MYVLNARKRHRIMAAIAKWQTNPMAHPMTCGVKSSHPPLVPVEDGITGLNILLYCTKCGYLQSFIPDPVFRENRKEPSLFNQLPAPPPSEDPTT